MNAVLHYINNSVEGSSPCEAGSYRAGQVDCLLVNDAVNSSYCRDCSME
jgi:hypothetical protein